MVNFFHAMAQALQTGRLPEGEELDVQAPRRGDHWYGLSPAEQQRMVQGVRQLFAHHPGVVVKYSPMLRSLDTYYRPITCIPDSVITTLLSGEQDLHSLDESGSSCQWSHIFSEHGGISHVNHRSRRAAAQTVALSLALGSPKQRQWRSQAQAVASAVSSCATQVCSPERSRLLSFSAVSAGGALH